jgi:hypothetical protein
MALRKPIVFNAGWQQLQSGDTLDAPRSDAAGLMQTNDNVGAMIAGQVVYNDVADGVKSAQANAAGTKDVVGLMLDTPAAAGTGFVAMSGPVTLTTAQWDAVFGTSGGLTKGTRYYLSATTAGQGTSTAPSTVGQYVVELGIAISTTELLLAVKDPLLL